MSDQYGMFLTDADIISKHTFLIVISISISKHEAFGELVTRCGKIREIIYHGSPLLLFVPRYY
jgi:hypothetical protein